METVKWCNVKNTTHSLQTTKAHAFNKAKFKCY